MPDKITFTSVQLLGFSRDADGGVAKFSATLGAPVMRALDWSEMPECLTGGKLEGELAASSLQLTPNDEALKRNAIQLETSKVGKFEVVRLELETSKGKGHRKELRFQASFSDIKGARKLEEYILTAGKSTAVVSYTKQAQQADLPGVEVRDDAQGTIDQVQ